MADLIHREAAITTAVKGAIDWNRLANPQYSIAYCIGEALRALPSVDAVEVVRCKDCTYYESLENGYGICKDISGLGRWWKPDDFCSYGERVADD